MLADVKSLSFSRRTLAYVPTHLPKEARINISNPICRKQRISDLSRLKLVASFQGTSSSFIALLLEFSTPML